MNQILSTENFNDKKTRNRRSGKDVHSIARFFAIILIIFGIFLIASSSFALYKGNTNTKDNGGNVAQSQPEIEVENKDEKTLILTIMHESEIREVLYYWNDEDTETISGEGRKYIQTKIEIPKGENTLTVKATDVNGQVSEFTKEYTLKGDIDIKNEQSGNNIKIKVTGKEEIEKIDYTWDEEETKTIEVNDTEYSFEVEVSLGEHQLIVKATDVKGNTEEKTITVTGTTKPTVKISAGDDCYVITAHDDVALDRVEIETMSDGKITKMQADGEDFEYNFPLKEGDNYIKVTAYNSKGVASKSKKAVWKR